MTKLPKSFENVALASAVVATSAVVHITFLGGSPIARPGFILAFLVLVGIFAYVRHGGHGDR